jgi:hypothetical protein
MAFHRAWDEFRRHRDRGPTPFDSHRFQYFLNGSTRITARSVSPRSSVCEEQIDASLNWEIGQKEGVGVAPASLLGASKLSNSKSYSVGSVKRHSVFSVFEKTEY